MTPGARAAAAIEVLDVWLRADRDPTKRMEAILRAWGRANRFAGSGDRRAIADIAYDCLRRRRSLARLSGAEGGRGLVHGLALADAWSVEAIFSGEGHAPPPIRPEEVAGDSSPASDPVRFDHPDWLEAPLKASLGGDYGSAMAAMAERAPVDLRANRLKIDRDAALAALRDAGVEAAPFDMPSASAPTSGSTPDVAVLSPDAIRCPAGARVATTTAYRDGLVEIQDAASQAAVEAATPAPGETVLDYCAGGGGKTLALAALMEGRGRLIAHDVAPRRMADLPERARRAGARVEILSGPPPAALKGACDLVFVDAPCSGSGTWRRDPEAKWRLDPERLEAYLRAQRDALAAAAAYVRKGGRIAYATCSMLNEENTNQFKRFLGEAAFESQFERSFSPSGGTDGFYCAVAVRRA